MFHKKQGREFGDSMSPPPKSKPLHNFSLPHLKWGNQQFLRCFKDNPNIASNPYFRSSNPRLVKKPDSTYSPSSPLDGDVEEKQTDAIPDKLTFNLRLRAAQMGVSVMNEIVEEESGPAPPWNLRKRRSAALLDVMNKDDLLCGKTISKERRTNLLISLSREEIEEDFAAMAGKKLPKRPKKRPKTVQKYLDSMFPGSSLTEITLDSYKVEVLPDSGT